MESRRHTRDGKIWIASLPYPLQFYVADGKLSSQLYQRSADVFLGVPLT